MDSDVVSADDYEAAAAGDASDSYEVIGSSGDRERSYVSVVMAGSVAAPHSRVSVALASRYNYYGSGSGAAYDNYVYNSAAVAAESYVVYVGRYMIYGVDRAPAEVHGVLAVAGEDNSASVAGEVYAHYSAVSNDADGADIAGVWM